MRRRSAAIAALVTTTLLGACSSGSEERAEQPPSSPASTTEPTPEPPEPPAPETERLPRADPDEVRRSVAVRTVEYLAEEIGPRPGTSPAYFRAARWVQGQLQDGGWLVERQRFETPAGVTVYTPDDGRPIPGGPSVNLVATRGDVRPGEPWLAVGAHLDTVPTGPGAEDNASGIGALLAVASAVAENRTRLPVVLLVFGSEEPRGLPDDDHHYGSRAYVASLSPGERRGLQGMLALDRVGVGEVMPVASAEDEPTPLRAELLAAAGRLGIPTVAETGQRSSDHWSFVRDGLPGARLGSTPYAGYHDAGDTPDVVSAEQLERAARLTVEWLR